MARERSPARETAEKMYLDNDGSMKLKDIASKLGLGDTQIRKWKSIDRWDDKLKGNVTNHRKGNVTNQPQSDVRKRGAPKGSKNALGNSGGAGGPPRNHNAVSHGFFRRIFPDDEETNAIIGEINVKSPIEILWENIVIQYTAIARAQRIMFVTDKDDETKVLKRQKETETGWEKEWELQHSWDKQANFLQAQSRAIGTLEGLLARYEEMLATELKNEKRHLELDKIKLEMEKLRGNGDGEKKKMTVMRWGSQPS